MIKKLTISTMESLAQLDVFYYEVIPYLSLPAVCSLRCCSKSLLNAMTESNLMVSFTITIKNVIKTYLDSECHDIKSSLDSEYDEIKSFLHSTYDEIIKLFIDNKCFISGNTILQAIVSNKITSIEIHVPDENYETVKNSKRMMCPVDHFFPPHRYWLLLVGRICWIDIYPTSDLISTIKNKSHVDIANNYYDVANNRLFIENFDTIMKRIGNVTKRELLVANPYLMMGFNLNIIKRKLVIDTL